MSNVPTSKAVADAYFKAYNVGDLMALGTMLSDDISFRFNRSAMALKGKSDVLAMLGEIREQFPDRHFESGPTEIVAGDHAVIDHTWTGTAAADVPAMGVSKGSVVRQELVTVLTVSDGLVVEYQDFNYA